MFLRRQAEMQSFIRPRIKRSLKLTSLSEALLIYNTLITGQKRISCRLLNLFSVFGVCASSLKGLHDFKRVDGFTVHFAE